MKILKRASDARLVNLLDELDASETISSETAHEIANLSYQSGINKGKSIIHKRGILTGCATIFGTALYVGATQPDTDQPKPNTFNDTPANVESVAAPAMPEGVSVVDVDSGLYRVL